LPPSGIGRPAELLGAREQQTQPPAQHLGKRGRSVLADLKAEVAARSQTASK